MSIDNHSKSHIPWTTYYLNNFLPCNYFVSSDMMKIWNMILSSVGKEKEFIFLPFKFFWLD